LYADCSFNGILMFNLGRGRFGGAYIGERDSAAYDFYYDYLTLLFLAAALPRGARRRELAARLRAAYRSFARAGAAPAREVLAPVFSRPPEGEAGTFELSAVGHGHLDLAWLWPIRETIRKAARTYAGALRNIEKYPDYIYGTSQPQQLWWTKKNYPEIYRKVREAILAGRIEMQGGFWVECDTNLPGGESLIRQGLYGQRFIREEFHREMKIAWLPDAFGFSAALPQILRGCGMEYFSTIKLAWNKVNVFPHRSFWWEGIDKSRVLVHMPPEGDYNSHAQPANLLEGIKKSPEGYLKKALLVYGAGDGGGGPNESHLELLEREKRLPDLPRIRLSPALAFFEALKAGGVREVYRGELYLETHQGTYTTQGQNKYHNRLCERLLHNAEVLAALAAALPGKAGEAVLPRTLLDEAWREVLLYQFHDIIPGSSITRVNREAVEGYRKIEAALQGFVTGALAALPPPVKPGSAGPGINSASPCLVNLTSFERQEYFYTGGAWFRARIPPYAAVPAEPAEGPFPGLSADKDSLSNGLLTLRFGPGGQIISCTGPEGRELAADRGLNRLILFKDKFQIPFNAWDIDPRYRKRRKRRLRPFSVTSALNGPRAERVCRYRFGKSFLTQRIILEHERNLVLFETEVEWHERHRMLRAEFYPRDYGDRVKCEIQFGHIVRRTTENNPVEKAQFEVSAHRWAAVEKEGRGFALLNDCKYGHRLKKGLMSLNLLRAPTFPDPQADRGSHRFTYAFCPFEAGNLSPVIQEAYRLNHPVLTAPGPFPSLARVSSPQVILETIKPAESGKGAALRLYESLGREGTVRVETILPHRRADEADFLENPGEPADLQNLEFAPFEIKTLLLTPAADPS
ncbi:MAG: glycosyl hydrolase-related protein, partial [Spirochaetales bacterium]|jgi:alpha-mannosidase|nr:glycosyl hydrolase-related protein [Spirochaetales bacterium]